MKNINTTSKNNTQKTPQTILALVIVFLIAVIAVSFTMAKFKGKSNQVTQEVIENLIAENEENPLAESYLVTDNCISRVPPQTEVEAFVIDFFKKGEIVSVYKDKNCTEPVTDGFVASGMYAKYELNERVYDISVLGDIHEKTAKVESGATLAGDGVLNQIELTRDIRSCVDENWMIDDEVEKKSADVNCANQVDELSVKTIVDYLVFGDLNIPEVDDVVKPSIEVVSGNMNEHSVYTSDVVLKITENDDDAQKTVYKITGDKTQNYKEAVSGEQVTLNANGTYKVTAYTYGKLENKSKMEYKIITIDKTANYTMEYYLEGVDGEFTKVDEDTKTVEGIIGETVEIESKLYTDYELDVDNSSAKMQGAVLEDDSLVLKAYYTRKEYTYTFVAGDNVTGVLAEKVGNTNGTSQAGQETQNGQGTQSNQTSTSITAKWGEKINIDATVAEQSGYTIDWKNWENINDENEKIANKQTQLTIGKANKNYRASATKTIVEYSISYVLNNGTIPTDVSNKTKYTVETENFTLTNPSRPGYEFKGWTGGVVNTNGEIDDTAEAGNTPNVSSPTTQIQIKSGSLGNRKYTANWQAITNTPYKIQYYKETLKTGEFTLEEEEDKGGTTDTTATVTGTAKNYAGFEFDASNENNVTSGKITADGKLVLKLYYARKTYDLTIVAGANVATASAQGETLEQGSEGETSVGKYTTSSSKLLKYKYGQKVTISAVLQNVAGYEYGAIHWTSSNTDLISNIAEEEKEITMVAGNITLTAVAERNKIEYTIGYVLNGGSLPTGISNLTTYTVESPTITISNLQNGSKLGYNFAGWTGSNGNVPSLNVTIPTGSTGNKEYIANWTEADFGYTVEYYYEKDDGYEKDESKTETGKAKYNSTVSDYIDKVITGYELKETPTEITIKTDETQNVMKVYYVKKKHTLTLQSDANIVSVTGFGEFKYGDQVDIDAVLRTEDGYTITFAGWVSQTTGISNISTKEARVTIPDSDVVLKATTTKIADTYSITYMDNGGTLSEGNPDSYTIESNDITLVPPTKQGYVFAGWTGGTEKTDYGTTGNTEIPDKNLVIRTGSKGDRVYEANWVGDTKTAYKVEHYKENLDGTYPTTATETVDKEGTTDAKVIASHKEYEGFEFDSSNENNVLQDNVKPDGSLVLKVYYKRCYYELGLVADTNIDNVSYSVKDGIGAKEGTATTGTGKQLQGEFKYGTQINISAEVEQATGYTTTWSKWQSNNSQKIIDQATQTALIGVPAGSVTLTAKATRSANTYKYHVKYYYDEILDSDKTVENEVAYGTQITNYPNKNITGFVFDKDKNKPLTVTENEGTNVIKVYYKHVNYDIDYDLDGGVMPTGEQSNPDKYSVLTDTFTLVNPVKTGYTFLGWTGSNGTDPQQEVTITKGSTGNKNYKANWRANTDTRYVIEHYEEDLDGDFVVVTGYTEELYGTTGETVTIQGHIKDLTGYSYYEESSVSSGKIKGDGTTSLKVYYRRNEYTLNLKAGENVETVSYNVTNEHAIAEGYPLSNSGTDISVKLKYGAGLTISGVLKNEEHYSITNGKWTSSHSSVNPTTLTAEIVIPAADVTLNASATKTGLPYKYYSEYYFENVLDRSYEDTANYKTTISNYIDRCKTGYKFDHVEGLPLEITENEATNLIKVYYVLQNYTIAYDLDGGSLEQGVTNPESYNITTDTFTLNNPKKTGYVFLGWTGSNGTEAQKEVSVTKGSTGNKSFKANWKPSDETVYKVEHYIEKVDSTEDSSSSEINKNNYTLYVNDGIQTTFTGTTGQQATASSVEITGFTYNDAKSAEAKTATIAADGSTVLKLYYTRNSYKLKLAVGDENISLVSNGGTTSESEIEKSYKYEQTVEIGAATSKITGHITAFDKWISNNQDLMQNISESAKTISIPAGDVTLTATGSRTKAKYTYKVYYYYENANGEMVEDEAETFTSEAIEYDSEVISYPDKVKTGYVLDRAETVPFRISANLEDNKINVYYKLINYSISYNLNEGELQNEDTNPESYNILSQDITLKNPEREGYVFLGWTGGVVNEQGEVDNTLPTGTSENVAEPTKALKIETGSLGKRKYTANWVERTYIVTVKHYLAKQETETEPEPETDYNNNPVEVANEEIFTSQTLGEAYEVEDLILDYDEYGVVINSDVDKRDYLDDKEFKIVGNSGNTSGVYTKQDIVVIFYYQYYPVVKITSSPAQELVNKEYITMKQALEAIKKAGLTKSSELTTMEMLRDDKNENFIVDNLNVQIDLNNYTINSNAELTDDTEELETQGLESATIMLKNSKLTLVDLGENGTGKVSSKNCSGVFVSSDSEFTFGIEERPVYLSPEIEAKIDGVKKEVNNSVEGVFNFFDGKIIGENSAINGTTDLTPLIYERYLDVDEQGRTVATLRIVSGVEARIGRTTYSTIEDAIAAVDEGEEQTEIVLLKNLSKENTVVFPYNKNIKLDLAGYTFTTTSSDYVIDNQGKLEIVDSSASEENVYGEGKIISTTNSVILNTAGPSKLIKQYEFNDMETTTTNGFNNIDGKFVSNNYGSGNTTARGYIEIDLTNYDESKDYILTVNAQVSSEENYDFGFATIRENTSAPGYNEENGRFISISGQQAAANYTKSLKGGKKYYLHLGYRKDGSANSNDDCFTVNSIKLSEKYIADLTLTNGNYCLDVEGTSSTYKSIVYGAGNIIIGKENSTYRTNMYSTKNYTRATYITGYTIVNDVNINMTASGSSGLVAGGELEIKKGTINSYAESIIVSSSAPNGTIVDINNLTSKEVEIDANAIATIKNSSITTFYAYNGANVTLENSTFSSTVYGYGSSKCLIKSGSFQSVTARNITVESGTFNGKFTASTGTNLIKTGTFNGEFSLSGTTTIENGYFKGFGQTNGTVNIKNGTFRNSARIENDGTLNIYNIDYNVPTVGSGLKNNSGNINIYGGTLETSGNTINNNDNNGVVNIYSGNIITNGEYSCVYNTKGTINIGNKDDETIGSDKPVIEALSGCGVDGFVNSTDAFNFYDGTIKAKVDQTIICKINEIPDELDILVSYEGENNEIEVNTLGVSQRPVAQIGSTPYYNLQSAIDACPEGVETTVKVVDRIVQAKEVTVEQNQNVILDLNGYRIKSHVNGSTIKNNGTLSIIDDNTESEVEGKIYSFGQIINNNSILNLGDITLEKHSQNNNIVVNSGTLSVDGTTIDMKNAADNIGILNNSNADLSINNLTIDGVVTYRQHTMGIYNKSSKDINISNTNIKNTQYVLKNEGTGELSINNCDFELKTDESYITHEGVILNKNGNVVIDGGKYRCNSFYNRSGSWPSEFTIVLNNGTGKVHIKDGNFSFANCAIKQTGAGTAQIDGGIFTSLEDCYIGENKNASLTINNINYTGRDFIFGNTGNIVIYNGTVTTNNYYSVNSTDGNITIYNINFTQNAAREAIYNLGKLTILGGTLKSTSKSTSKMGLIENKGTLIIGKDDDTVGKEVPSLNGRNYGVINLSGTFEFYDGVIEGADGNSIEITSGNFVHPEDYNLIKEKVTRTIGGTNETREIAYLDVLDVAQVGEEKFKNLQSAVNYCSGEEYQTIELLRDITLGSGDSAITIPQNKNIKLDLKDFKITAGNNVVFENNGSLEIIDNYESVEGEIVSETGVVFENSGSLKVTAGSIKTNSTTYDVDGTASTCYTIINTGNTTVNGGSIYGKKSAILNKNEGTVSVLSGSVTTEKNSSSAITSNSGNVTVASGTIEASCGLNIKGGTVNINGGTIKCYSNSFVGNASVTMIAGTLESYFNSAYEEYYNVYLAGNAEFTVSGGKIEHDIYLDGSSSVRITGGEFVKGCYNVHLNGTNTSASIEGGNFTASTKNIYSVSQKNVTVSGGIFNCTNGSCIYCHHTKLTISDGAFNASDRTCIGGLESEIKISGGTFNAITSNPSNDSDVGAIYNSKGDVQITKANITGYNGIFTTDDGNKLTLGVKDSIIDNENIIINATNYGVVSQGQNKVFNYYDGKITAKEPIYGSVQDVPNGYRLSKTENDDLYDTTLIPIAKIARIEGKEEYLTLQDAVNAADNGDEIEITSSYYPTEKETFEVSAGKEVTIDLNGFVIGNHGNFAVNKGGLKIIDSSNGTGIIKGYSYVFIENTGALEIGASIEQTQTNVLINNSGSGSIKVLNGDIKINDNKFYNNHIIKTSSNGRIEICGGTFTVNPLYNSTSGYAVYFIYNTGVGDIDISEGQVIMNTLSNINSYGIYTSNNTESEVAKISISGGSFNTSEQSSRSYFVYSTNYTDLEVTGGTVRAIYGIDMNGGTATIDGETVNLQASSEGIYIRSGIVNVKNGTITSSLGSWNEYGTITNYGTLKVSGGTIKNTNGTAILNKSGKNLEITGGNIEGGSCGIYNLGIVTMTDGCIDNASNYGVYLNGGSLTLGVNNLAVSTKKPSITSGGYGVYKNDSSSEFNFYDGIIKGSTMAISGVVNDMPEGFKVQTTEDNKTATLELDAQVNHVAEMNGGYYATVQLAINDARNTSSTIHLQRDVVITAPLIIGEEQNITLDMQGHKIYLSEGEYAIQNNGILAIIDTISEGSVIENLEKGKTSGGDRIGTCIYNSTTGTLTIGENDNIVKFAPTIIGDKYSIENHGVLNVYDGQFEAVTAPVAGTQTKINIPDGYTCDTVVDDDSGVKTMKLIAE